MNNLFIKPDVSMVWFFYVATTEEKGQSQEKMSATEEFDEKMTSAQEKDFEEGF